MYHTVGEEGVSMGYMEMQMYMLELCRAMELGTVVNRFMESSWWLYCVQYGHSTAKAVFSSRLPHISGEP